MKFLLLRNCSKGSNQKRYRMGCSVSVYLMQSPAWGTAPEEFHYFNYDLEKGLKDEKKKKVAFPRSWGERRGEKTLTFLQRAGLMVLTMECFVELGGSVV